MIDRDHLRALDAAATPGPIPKYATGGFTGPPVADMTPRPLWGGVVVVPEAGRDYTALLEAINNGPISKETR